MPIATYPIASTPIAAIITPPITCDCNVTATLVPKGGDGCGIEVSNGVAYSIGTQIIDVSYDDDCDSVESVYINGSLVPTIVNDGEAIYVTIVPKPNFVECGTPIGAVCSQPVVVGMAATQLGMRLRINKKEIINRIKLAKLKQKLGVRK